MGVRMQAGMGKRGAAGHVELDHQVQALPKMVSITTVYTIHVFSGSGVAMVRLPRLLLLFFVLPTSPPLLLAERKNN